MSWGDEYVPSLEDILDKHLEAVERLTAARITYNAAAESGEYDRGYWLGTEQQAIDDARLRVKETFYAAVMAVVKEAN